MNVERLEVPGDEQEELLQALAPAREGRYCDLQTTEGPPVRNTTRIRYVFLFFVFLFSKRSALVAGMTAKRKID